MAPVVKRSARAIMVDDHARLLLDYIDLTDDSLSDVDLKPAALKEFILANRDALLDEARSLVH